MKKAIGDEGPWGGPPVERKQFPYPDIAPYPSIANYWDIYLQPDERAAILMATGLPIELVDSKYNELVYEFREMGLNEALKFAEIRDAIKELKRGGFLKEETKPALNSLLKEVEKIETEFRNFVAAKPEESTIGVYQRYRSLLFNVDQKAKDNLEPTEYGDFGKRFSGALETIKNSYDKHVVRREVGTSKFMKSNLEIEKLFAAEPYLVGGVVRKEVASLEDSLLRLEDEINSYLPSISETITAQKIRGNSLGGQYEIEVEIQDTKTGEVGPTVKIVLAEPDYDDYEGWADKNGLSIEEIRNNEKIRSDAWNGLMSERIWDNKSQIFSAVREEVASSFGKQKEEQPPEQAGAIPKPGAQQLPQQTGEVKPILAARGYRLVSKEEELAIGERGLIDPNEKEEKSFLEKLDDVQVKAALISDWYMELSTNPNISEIVRNRFLENARIWGTNSQYYSRLTEKTLSPEEVKRIELEIDEDLKSFEKIKSTLQKEEKPPPDAAQAVAEQRTEKLPLYIIERLEEKLYRLLDRDGQTLGYFTGFRDTRNYLIQQAQVGELETVKPSDIKTENKQEVKKCL